MDLSVMLDHIGESALRALQDPTQSVMGWMAWVVLAFTARGLKKVALPAFQPGVLAARILSSLSDDAVIDDKTKVVIGDNAVVCYGGKSFRKSIQYNGEDASPYLSRRERKHIYNKAYALVLARDGRLADSRKQAAAMKEQDRRRKLGIA